jgi:hypothetical protein
MDTPTSASDLSPVARRHGEAEDELGPATKGGQNRVLVVGLDRGDCPNDARY